MLRLQPSMFHVRATKDEKAIASADPAELSVPDSLTDQMGENIFNKFLGRSNRFIKINSSFCLAMNL